MNDKDLEKLIYDMADEYVRDNRCFLLHDEDVDIEQAFIEGFKAGLNFKENK